MLQIRNVPEHIYKALLEQSRAERRSLSRQALIVLERGLEAPVDLRARRRDLIRRIRELDKSPYKDLPDAATLIREDRDR
jgi:hypothetical protein